MIIGPSETIIDVANLATFTDADLFARGVATMIASWEAYASGAAEAAVHRAPGVVCAIFPRGPERGFYNNAILDRRLGAVERADALDAMAAAYEAAGVSHFAAWVHEDDGALCDDLERRGYAFDCGIYNVSTIDRARRRGLATALTGLHLHDALARGCQTASLQATPMAERMDAAQLA